MAARLQDHRGPAHPAGLHRGHDAGRGGAVDDEVGGDDGGGERRGGQRRRAGDQQGCSAEAEHVRRRRDMTAAPHGLVTGERAAAPRSIHPAADVQRCQGRLYAARRQPSSGGHGSPQPPCAGDQAATAAGLAGVRRPATTAATAAATAASTKPFAKPVSVSPTRLAAATLDTTAAPMEAPNSWKVLTMPEAMPASCGRHLAECGGRGDDEHRAGAGGRDGHADDDGGRVHRHRRNGHADRGHDQSAHGQRPRTHPGDRPAGEVGAEHRRQRDRQEQQPGAAARRIRGRAGSRRCRGRTPRSSAPSPSG